MRYLLLLLASTLALFAEPIVSRNIADPATSSWQPGPWNTADLRVSQSAERPADSASDAGSLHLIAAYNGKGFQYGGFNPQSDTVPGHLQELSVWLKPTSERHSWILKFLDAQGRDTVDGKKLEAGFKLDTGVWQQVTFTIPKEWEQPVRLNNISCHNWARKQDAAEAGLLVHDLRLYTDIATVTDTSELVTLQVNSGVPRNIFTAGETVAYQVIIDSWLGREDSGTMTSTVTDTAGEVVATESRAFTVGESTRLQLPLGVDAFGVYRADLSVKLESGITYAGGSRFAYVPSPPELTAEAQRRSPWGINIHGGKEDVSYHGIRRAGFTWVRDYAYAFDWMVRARGDDGQYSAWPWYPRMDKALEESGLMLLACLMHGISGPVGKGILAPTQEWKRDLLHILWAFPQYTAWEIDNEYDLHYRQEAEARQWVPYDAYHKLFGDTVNFVDDDDWAVENGTAGIHPERVRQSIARGAFDNIDVVNAHFYCGISPPEIAVKNTNTGGDALPPAMVWDLMRELAEAADSDGRDRQAWITEFGWDTLAVYVVDETTQAAYLQRGFLLGLQSNLDKMFWYWNHDTTGEPNTFFDGCGIFSPEREPKPVVAAVAAMTHVLPAPEPVGTFDFGANSMGHVFRTGDRLIACAFRVDPEQPAPGPAFTSGTLHDMYGNPLAEPPERLALAPTWAYDIDPADPILRQTAYDIATRRFLRSTAGDATTVQLRVRNTRDTAISARFQVTAPEGWQIEPAAAPIEVPAGETALIPIRVALPATAPATEDDILITVHEGTVSKRLPVRFLFLPAAGIAPDALSAVPGKETLSVKLRNNSLQARDYSLRLDLPASWQAPRTTIPVAEVPAGATRTVEVPLSWSLEMQPGESASIAVLTATGEEVDRQGIRPGAFAVPGVERSSITLDGNLADWPAESRLPAWMLGASSAALTADLRVAHADGGLLVGLHVPGSDGSAFNPRQFWRANTLELFLDSANDKAPRDAFATTDHQYWFCPLLAEDRVFAGRWKRGEEIPEIQYDLPGIDSAAAATDNGYTMEFFLPAERLTGTSATAGSAFGINLNITVPGTGADSMGSGEIYWPSSKQGPLAKEPHTWGVIYFQ